MAISVQPPPGTVRVSFTVWVSTHRASCSDRSASSSTCLLLIESNTKAFQMNEGEDTKRGEGAGKTKKVTTGQNKKASKRTKKRQTGRHSTLRSYERKTRNKHTFEQPTKRQKQPYKPRHTKEAQGSDPAKGRSNANNEITVKSPNQQTTSRGRYAPSPPEHDGARLPSLAAGESDQRVLANHDLRSHHHTTANHGDIRRREQSHPKAEAGQDEEGKQTWNEKKGKPRARELKWFLLPPTRTF